VHLIGKERKEISSLSSYTKPVQEKKNRGMMGGQKEKRAKSNAKKREESLNRLYWPDTVCTKKGQKKTDLL